MKYARRARAGAREAVEPPRQDTPDAVDNQHSTPELVDMLTCGLPDAAWISRQRAVLRAIRRAIERERQRLRWARYCAGKTRRPVLTPTERKRPVPPITDDPAEALEAAWKAADPQARDRFLRAKAGRRA